MMGKWNVLRGDSHRNDRIGGLVSLEELQDRPNSSSGKSSKKRSPKLSLAKRPFGRRGSKRIGSSLSPPLHSASIFDNFPSAEYVTGFEVHDPPSPEQLHGVPPRPRTADQIGRRRSRTAPSTPYSRSPVGVYDGLEDKPLPPAVNQDTQSKAAVVEVTPTMEEKEIPVIVQENRPRANSLPRKDSLHSRRDGSETSLSPVKGFPKTYSLTPSVSPSYSESVRGSKITISKSTSNASTASTSHMERQGSHTSSMGPRSRSRPPNPITTTATTPTTSATVFTVPDMSILDEVEGTLSATITELQDLQAGWSMVPDIVPELVHEPSTASSETERPSTSGVPSRQYSRNRRPSGSYFAFPRSATEPRFSQQEQDPRAAAGSQSLPPTPLEPSNFAEHDAEFQSLKAAFEDQKRQLQAMAIENDNVRRQFSFLRSRFTELDSEREMHVRTHQEAQENVQTALQRLRDARVGEAAAQREMQSARNGITLLEARAVEQTNKLSQLELDLEGERNKSARLEAKLEEVNVQKIDLLERELDHRMDIVVTRKKLRKASEELNGLKAKSSSPAMDSLQKKLDDSLKHNEALEAQIKTASRKADVPDVIADMTFRLEDAEKQSREKDELIESLQRRVVTETEACLSLRTLNDQLSTTVASLRASPTRSRSSSPSDCQIIDLQKKIEGLDNTVQALGAEREQLAQLLQAEIRRTAVEVHSGDHPAGALLRQRVDLDEAIEMVRSRAKAYLKDSAITLVNEDDQDQPIEEAESGKVADLEKEIQYYLNDIVLYKLDVKGYKKDLRKAKERIRELSNTGVGKIGVVSLGPGSTSSRASGPADVLSVTIGSDDLERVSNAN